jgi:hypothetical protein
MASKKKLKKEIRRLSNELWTQKLIHGAQLGSASLKGYCEGAKLRHPQIIMV